MTNEPNWWEDIYAEPELKPKKHKNGECTCRCEGCVEAKKATPENPGVDRRWMQNDFMDNFSDSTNVTPHVLKRRAEIGNLRFVEEGKGNLISSMIQPGQHRPVLDLDMQHVYVPSTTPGHGHLYINNVVLNDLEHYLLISTLVQLGILGKGSQHQLEVHGLSLTRPPHEKKKDEYGHPLEFDAEGNRIFHVD